MDVFVDCGGEEGAAIGALVASPVQGFLDARVDVVNGWRDSSQNPRLCRAAGSSRKRAGLVVLTRLVVGITIEN